MQSRVKWSSSTEQGGEQRVVGEVTGGTQREKKGSEGKEKRGHINGGERRMLVFFFNDKHMLIKILMGRSSSGVNCHNFMKSALSADFPITLANTGGGWDL